MNLLCASVEFIHVKFASKQQHSISITKQYPYDEHVFEKIKYYQHMSISNAQ